MDQKGQTREGPQGFQAVHIAGEGGGQGGRRPIREPGDGGERTLAKAVRAHGNAAETIPLALFLMLLAELVGVAAWFLHAMGITLVLARAWHAYGLSRRAGMSPGRFVGMTTTFVVIIALAVAAFARIV
jgi:uncharacterized membrane protein YecN with MAPEG domain